MATVADLIDAFLNARTPLVQALEKTGPVNLNGPNGQVYVWSANAAEPLGVSLQIAKPAASITVTTAGQSTVTSPPPNATPAAPPATGAT